MLFVGVSLVSHKEIFETIWASAVTRHPLSNKQITTDR